MNPSDPGCLRVTGEPSGDAALQPAAELRAGEDRLSQAARMAHLGYWDRDFVRGAVALSDETCRIFGLPLSSRAPTIAEWHAQWLALIDPDDRERVAAAFAASLAGGPRYEIEYRVRRADGSERDVHSSAELTCDARGAPVRMFGIVIDVTERRKGERARLAHLAFIESMDRINRAIQSAHDVDRMMGDVLAIVLEIFACDRAFLMYPCDPEARSWRVPMERTTSGRPGAYAPSVEVPMDEDVAATLRALLASDRPLAAGPGGPLALPASVTERFGVRAYLGVAMRLRLGPPWHFGIHQCSHERIWTTEEHTLLQEIGRRLADGLTSLLSLRDLTLSEAKYRRMVDTANEGIIAIDSDAVITFVNARIASMLGYRAEELLGRPIVDFMPQEERTEHLSRLTARREGHPESYERRMVRRDGTRVWALVAATPVFDAEHRYEGSFAMLTDITERKAAEDRLRRSEQRLAAAQRIAQVGSWELDLATDRLVLSDELYRIFEIDRARFRASYDDLIDAVHPDDRVWVDRTFRASVRDRASFDIVHRLQMPDGRIKYVNDRCEIHDDGEGRPLKSIGTIHDITALKAAEAALAESRAMLASTIDSAMDAVITTDREHRVQVFNRAAEQTFGYAAADVIGRDVQMLVPLTHRERHLEQMQRFVDAPTPSLEMGGHNIRRPIYGLRADGEVFPMEASISRIDHGHPSAYVVIGRDITERQLATNRLIEMNARLEARVEERTRELEHAKNLAESANRAKSAFLANMSHEIRTPLNSVLGMAHLALQTETTPKQRDYLEKINLSGNHLLGILNDILDFSKIEAGMLEIEASDFDLDACLHGIIELCRLRADAKGLELTLDIDPATPAAVHGDELRIGQILTNLVTNAIKFTERGRVAIRVGPVPPAETRADAPRPLHFEVQDTGVGISADAMAKLFNPFQQADASTTRKYGGTGLGLAICLQLVQLMGGRIGVESVPGVGSTFRFELPLEPAAAARHTQPSPLDSPPLPSAALSGLRGKRIVLADDHPLNQEVGAQMLEAVGVEVRLADNGIQAVELALHGPAHALLMDVQMPGMDGHEATRRIRADPRGAALPIVAMTANASKHDREQCLAAGMNDFISKPIDADLLYDVLLHWLAGAASPRRDGAHTAPDGDAPAVRERKLFDLTVLTRIIGSDDASRLETYTHKSIASLEAGLRAMDEALAAGDLHGFGRLAHRIKSVAATLGAEGLAELLAAAERTASAGTPGDAASAHARARALFERIRQRLDPSRPPGDPAKHDEEGLR